MYEKLPVMVVTSAAPLALPMMLASCADVTEDITAGRTVVPCRTQVPSASLTLPKLLVGKGSDNVISGLMTVSDTYVNRKLTVMVLPERDHLAATGVSDEAPAFAARVGTYSP